MTLKALLLDFFGTLARVRDEEAYLEDVSRGLARALGVDGEKALKYFLEARRLANAIREASNAEIPVDGQAALIAALAGGRPDEVRKVLVESMLKHLEPVEHAPEFLHWAKGRFKLAIVSNTTCRCYIEEVLKRVGGAVDVIVTSDVIRYRKPHRLIFKIALRRLGVAPSETIMVGDDDVDLGARALGILTVIVGGRVAGDLNFRDLEELRRWLEERAEP